MEKKEFTRLYAQQNHSSSAAAADEVDRVVAGLLRRLRAGKPVSLPGLGALLPSGSDKQDAPPRIRTRKESR
jgi:nucleoid DNA-binding protein